MIGAFVKRDWFWRSPNAMKDGARTCTNTDNNDDDDDDDTDTEAHSMRTVLKQIKYFLLNLPLYWCHSHKKALYTTINFPIAYGFRSHFVYLLVYRFAAQNCWKWLEWRKTKRTKIKSKWWDTVKSLSINWNFLYRIYWLSIRTFDDGIFWLKKKIMMNSLELNACVGWKPEFKP